MKWIKSAVYFSELPDSMRLSPYRRDKRGSWIFALGLVAYEKFFRDCRLHAFSFLGTLFGFSSCSAQSCCEASNLILPEASCGASTAACRSKRGLYLGRSWAR